jgi:hypothetical protein
VSRVIVGIDNGLTGALVALSDHPGPPISMLPMPKSRHRSRNEIDLRPVIDYLRGFSLMSLTVIIEEPSNSKTKSTAFSVAQSFHSIRGVLEAEGIRWHRITPQTWQKVMIPGCETGETKNAALTRARQLWPHEIWRKTPKCSTPDTGLIDAALIAEYGRRQNL